MITDKMIESVKEVFKDSLEVDVIKSSNTPYDWVALGMPIVLEEVETANGYSAVFDQAYGLLYLFKGDECIARGKRELATEHCVMLDKEYYSSSKYLWF